MDSEDPDNETPKRRDAYSSEEKTPRDHALAFFKAGLSLVPFVGGAIASLIGDYIPEATDKARRRALDLLIDRLMKLEGRIDTEAINKDEFSELFKSCYLVIVSTHNDTKLRAAARILTSVLLKKGDAERLSYTELDHYVRCLDALSQGAIRVLGTAYARAKSHGVENLDDKSFPLTLGQLCQDMEELNPFLVRSLVSELNSWNLLSLSGTAAVRMHFDANQTVELTPIGFRFVSHVLCAES
jgi:hypothetical protein